MIPNKQVEAEMAEKGYVTIPHAVATLGKHYSTLRAHVKSGRIKSIRHGGRIFMERGSLIEWAGEGAMVLLTSRTPREPEKMEAVAAEAQEIPPLPVIEGPDHPNYFTPEEVEEEDGW